MAEPVPAAFHCPMCNEDYPDFASFDSPMHKCCEYLTPKVAEKIIEARQRQRDRARRLAARYLALFPPAHI